MNEENMRLNQELVAARQACDNLHIKNKADGEFIEALQNDLNAADEAKTSIEHEHEKLKAQLEAVQLE